MKFQIKEVKKAVEFIELIKLIKTLSQHLTCMCTSDQIYIQIMDSSHVCLVDLIIPNTWFYIYESQNITFSVSANILTKVCAMYTLDSIIEFIIDDENPDKLDIHIMHKLQNKMFSIPLMDIERDILSTKDLDTKLDFQVNTKVLEKYVTELALFGEDITIECRDDKVYLGFIKSFFSPVGFFIFSMVYTLGEYLTGTSFCKFDFINFLIFGNNEDNNTRTFSPDSNVST